MKSFLKNSLTSILLIGNLLAETTLPKYNSLSKDSTERDYQTGAEIERVSPARLPPNVLGMYVPTQHKIYLANNLGTNENYVLKHESAHASGIKDEFRADAYALASTGTHLRPFGHANANLRSYV